MIKALFTAGTGMKVQQTNVDVIANNLANVNTTGFKRTQADFQDLLYIVQREPDASLQGLSSPTGVQIGSGAELVSTTKIFTNGVIEPTENPLDIAIQGEGFLQVSLPDGSTAYTRAGALRRDAQGTLTTAQGYPLADGITVPPEAVGISISTDGTVQVTDRSGATTVQGNLQLAVFANPAGLRAVGGNLFLESATSGAAQLATPGQDGAGSLSQGMLERSNVDVVQELVGLITAQRAYEVNSRAISVGDEMLREVNNLVR